MKYVVNIWKQLSDIWLLFTFIVCSLWNTWFIRVLSKLYLLELYQNSILHPEYFILDSGQLYTVTCSEGWSCSSFHTFCKVPGGSKRGLQKEASQWQVAICWFTGFQNIGENWRFLKTNPCLNQITVLVNAVCQFTIVLWKKMELMQNLFQVFV